MSGLALALMAGVPACIIIGGMILIMAWPDRPEAAVPVLRAPADTSRPFLRTASDLDWPLDRRLRACPICGMRDDGNLDSYHQGGWPCHALCKEWLGEWRAPAGTGRVPVRENPVLIADAYMDALRMVTDERMQRIALAGMQEKIIRCFGIPN